MNSEKYWLEWFKAAGIRALKTLAETAIATIGTTLVLHDVNWELVISASVLAAVLSLLASLGGIPEVELPEATEVTDAAIEEPTVSTDPTESTDPAVTTDPAEAETEEPSNDSEDNTPSNEE